MERKLVERYRQKVRDWETLRAHVHSVLPSLVGILVNDFQTKRVVLFGSMAKDEPSERPDIDLLVEGLDAARLGEASGRLLLAAPLPVDLVPLETGRREVVARALEEGIVIPPADPDFDETAGGASSRRIPSRVRGRTNGEGAPSRAPLRVMASNSALAMARW